MKYKYTDSADWGRAGVVVAAAVVACHPYLSTLEHYGLGWRGSGEGALNVIAVFAFVIDLFLQRWLAPAPLLAVEVLALACLAAAFWIF